MRLKVLLLTALCAGCGGGAERKDSPTTPLVPWANAPVTELAAPAGTPAPPCRARALRPDGKGFAFEPAPTGATGTVALRNAGTAPCRLQGRPQVRFVGAPKAPEQRVEALPAPPPPFPHLLRAPEWLDAIPPGGTATLTVNWGNWCVPGAERAKKPLIPPRSVRVTLPDGGGSLDVPYNAVTTCERPGEPSAVGVQQFQPPPAPSSAPWTDQFLTARVLTLAGRPGTLRARRGQELRYAVELRNRGRAPLTFDRCPFAAEYLAPNGTPETHRLNCAAARPLAPGAAERFEMRVRIPADAPEGPNGLFWELDPLGAASPEVVSRVIVEAGAG